MLLGRKLHVVKNTPASAIAVLEAQIMVHPKPISLRSGPGKAAYPAKGSHIFATFPRIPRLIGEAISSEIVTAISSVDLFHFKPSRPHPLDSIPVSLNSSCDSRKIKCRDQR